MKRLAYLANAGIPLYESMRMLGESATDPTRRILSSMADDLAEGLSLAQALRKFPTHFPEFEVNLIAIGEASGTLPTNFEHLATHLRQSDALTRKVLGALLYPALITLASLAIIAFLMLYLFPRIMPVFLSLRIELPLSTRILISGSEFIVQWWWLAGGVCVLLTAGSIALVRRNRNLRLQLARLVLQIPIAGVMLRDYHLAASLRTVSTLLATEVPITEAMKLAARTTAHPLYQDACTTLAEGVQRGERLSTRMASIPLLFPSITIQLIAVGERSGTLSETLLYLAELYEADVEERTHALSTLVEPALMIGMGLIVGFIAVSIIAPIYGITQHLHA